METPDSDRFAGIGPVTIFFSLLGIVLVIGMIEGVLLAGWVLFQAITK